MFSLNILASFPFAHSCLSYVALWKSLAFPGTGTSTRGSASAVPCSRQPCFPPASLPIGKSITHLKRKILPATLSRVHASLAFV